MRLWLWAHWTDVDAQMDEAFAQFEKWGIAGVKIDFMDRADQWMVNWYRSVAKNAAEHHLMLDYHGAFKPDGLRRTYPNVLTREGVMGAEYNKWSARETPTHNVTLAFTRMLAGPMDYTPGGFDNVTREDFEARDIGPSVMGTRAHQLGALRGLREPVPDGRRSSRRLRRPEGAGVSEGCPHHLGRDARAERPAGEVHHHRAAQRARMVRRQHHELGPARNGCPARLPRRRPIHRRDLRRWSRRRRAAEGECAGEATVDAHDGAEAEARAGRRCSHSHRASTVTVFRCSRVAAKGRGCLMLGMFRFRTVSISPDY